MHRLVHQQRPPQIPSTVPRDSTFQPSSTLQPFFFTDKLQHALNLLHRRRRNTNQQTSTPDGRDDIAGAVREQDKAQIGTVLLHRATEGGLSVASEMVGFIDDDDLEALFGGQVDLLGLGDLFEEVLDDDAVVVADVGGCDFEVVVGGDEGEFELAVAGRVAALASRSAFRLDLYVVFLLAASFFPSSSQSFPPNAANSPRCLKHPRIDLDLFHARPEERFQRGRYSRLLARAGRSIDEQMREVSASSLVVILVSACDSGRDWISYQCS